MSNFLISLLASASAGVWIYQKMMRRTGGNASNSLVGAGFAAFFVFLTFMVVLSLIF